MSTEPNQPAQPAQFVPERLNLWDRFFNRYRKVVHDRGEQEWHDDEGFRWMRNWIEYRIIDRLTGSERIERDYLT